jgi:hypothetical protein
MSKYVKKEVIKKAWKLKNPLTDEQEALVACPAINVMGESVAGSGKTTTMLERLARMLLGNDLKAFLTLFSKSMADELSPYAHARLDVGTINKMGNQLFFTNRLRPFVQAGKNITLMQKELGFDPNDFPEDERGKAWTLAFATSDLVDKMRVTLSDVNDLSAYISINSQYGCGCIDFDLAQRLLKLSIVKSKTGWIDFIDQIYAPLVHGFDFIQYDIGVIDECQDLSPMSAAFLEKCVKPDGRLTLVGDTRQSIMGFAGADTRMMEKLKDKFSCEVLPISYTFRCPKAVVSAIVDSKVHETIKAWSGAEDGLFDPSGAYDVISVPDNAMLLARRNAHLIEPALKAFNSGRKVSVLGDGIEKQMSSILRLTKSEDIGSLLDELYHMQENAVGKAMASGSTASTVDIVSDKYDTLLSFVQQCKRKTDIIPLIESVFKYKKDSLVFSSIHKSKGREADYVYIINSPNMTLNLAKLNDEEIQQEHNLKYVGMSRAKKSLIFLP